MGEMLHCTTGLDAFDDATKRQFALKVRRSRRKTPEAKLLAREMVATLIADMCRTPQTVHSIAAKLGRKHRGHLAKLYLAPMQAAGRLVCNDGFYSTVPAKGSMLP